MIIVCDEETCAWRSRTWLFLVLWLFTAFIGGVSTVHWRHKYRAERDNAAFIQGELEARLVAYAAYVGKECPPEAVIFRR